MDNCAKDVVEHLSLDENPISFSLASKVGLKESIIVQKIHDWLIDLSKSETLDEGLWIRKTYNEISNLFPWCLRTTYYKISKLEKLKILTSRSTFDYNTYKKCKLYTINYDELEKSYGVYLSRPIIKTDTSVSSLVQTAKFAVSSPENVEKTVFGDRCKLQNLQFPQKPSTFVTFFPHGYAQAYPQKIWCDTIRFLNTLYYINNIIFYKNNNKKYLVSPIQDSIARATPHPAKVVVFEKIRASGLNISDEQLTKWISEYGVEYVTEKIDLTESSNPKFREKFLNSALRLNWRASETKTKSFTNPKETKMALQVEPRHVAWFESLSPEQKNTVLEDVSRAFPYFEAHLDAGEVTILDKEFTSHSLFSLMVETLMTSFPSYGL